MVSTGWPKGAIRTGSIGSKMCDDRRHGRALLEVEGAAALQAPDCCANRKPEEQ
jgi:hypothetical protein